MIRQRLHLLLSLTVLFLAACASEATPPNLPVDKATQPPGTSTATNVVPQASAEEATVLPIATSRGPDLHATDPTTVSLATGGLQFVEFFRFT